MDHTVPASGTLREFRENFLSNYNVEVVVFNDLTIYFSGIWPITNQFNVWGPEVLELFLNPKINLMKSTMQWNGFDYPVGKRPRKKWCGKSNVWQNWTKEISSDITAHGWNIHPKVINYLLIKIWWDYVISSIFLTNLPSCNRRNHSKTIHPTETFISMNLLQMSCVIIQD